MQTAQYLKKKRQSENHIWSVDTRFHEKHFSEKLMRKMWWRNQSQNLFLNIKIEHFIQFVFILYPSRGLPKYIETKVLTFRFFSHLKFFKKQEEVWNLSPCLIFCMIFKEKYFLLCILCLIAFIS